LSLSELSLPLSITTLLSRSVSATPSPIASEATIHERLRAPPRDWTPTEHGDQDSKSAPHTRHIPDPESKATAETEEGTAALLLPCCIACVIEWRLESHTGRACAPRQRNTDERRRQLSR
jgi:hypothetical protein